jgi:hypothetical protein
MKYNKDPQTSRMRWLSISNLTHIVMHRAGMSSEEKVRWREPQSLDKAQHKVLTMFSLRASQGLSSTLNFLICGDFLECPWTSMQGQAEHKHKGDLGDSNASLNQETFLPGLLISKLQCDEKLAQVDFELDGSNFRQPGTLDEKQSSSLLLGALCD